MTVENNRWLVPYTSMGLFSLNIAMLMLTSPLYFTSAMGTWDHMSINLVMGSLIGVGVGVFLSAIMSIQFLITNSILRRRKANRWRSFWLCGPSIGIAIFLLATTLWNSLPSQRLKFVAKDELPGATRIRVTGASGFLGSDFVAVCNLGEATFLEWCKRQNLTEKKGIDIQYIIKNRSRIRSAKLVASLPTFTLPLQFSRLEGENDRHGVFALYDQNSSTAVIYRYFHD